ncbi:TetR/AcrR family transcriptional regulator [Pelotomaculum propionicicum]|uniref:TetR/AcrR family transcriptional regulator n=1 Tax=Pelotomaculum propionicicum TaxID=258475 RepID=UPI003B80FB8C
MEPVKGNRIERKKEETRKKIISTAVDLFNKQGFEETTVEQIAEAADVAKGTIFNHFPVKEAIVLAHVQTKLREAGPEIVRKVEALPDTRDRLAALFSLTNEWFQNSLNEDVIKRYMTYMIQTLLDTARNQEARSGYGNILQSIISMGQEKGEIRRDIPAETLAIYLDWQNALVMTAWLSYPEMSLTDMINRMTDLFLNGAIDRAGLRL